MKAEDLMIGDWVNVFDVPKQIEGIRTFKNGDEIVYYDGDNGNFIENVTPIPLTPEILEKNGFKEDSETNGIYWRPDCRKFCIVKELNTWYFAFRVLGETVDKSSGYICISECNYVHEFQHTLKLCGIEKEIIL
jgi:hypothetical protein